MSWVHLQLAWLWNVPYFLTFPLWCGLGALGTFFFFSFSSAHLPHALSCRLWLRPLFTISWLIPLVCITSCLGVHPWCAVFILSWLPRQWNRWWWCHGPDIVCLVLLDCKRPWRRGRYLTAFAGPKINVAKRGCFYFHGILGLLPIFQHLYVQGR